MSQLKKPAILMTGLITLN